MKKLKYNFFDKILSKILIVALVVTLCYVPGNDFQVEAATDAFETSISGFPESYKPYLRELHKKYPNWTFQAYNTNVDFNTAVTNEASKNRSLIENAYSKYLKSNESGDYNTSTGTYIAKDSSTWVSASKNAIAYFMDPRNFLNDTYIYMFEQLAYDSEVQTQEGVEAILYGSFMYNTYIGYLDSSGKYYSTKNLYSAKIMEAAQKSEVSAYYIAAKILQEIGRTKNASYSGMGASGSISGNYSSSYKGIYNFYNIGASSGADPVLNGLSWASTGKTYQRPWNTPGKSIIGGAQYIGAKYINCGQNTSYFQRFNVRSDGSYPIYTHQYMTNIYGCASEAGHTSSAYEELGIVAAAKTFVIPVYNNMPGDDTTVTLGSTGDKSGTVISTVNVRKGPDTSYGKVVTLSKGDAVTIVEGVMNDTGFSTRWLNNPYWYKIKVNKDGTSYTGYVAALYIDVAAETTVIEGYDLKLATTLSSGNETVYYMSDNPAIATVDSEGNVTGVSEGTVTIRAFTTSGSMSPCTVQVYMNGCVLNKKSLTISINTSKKLKATVYPLDATNKTVTWKSSNTKVAKVSSTGKVTGVGVGKATITATAAIGGVVGKCEVKVVIPVEKVTLNKKKKTLAVGKTYTLKATIAPSDATIKKVTWKSSDKTVAKVKKGVVTAVAPGTATITVTSKNQKKTATCTIKVIPKQMQFKSVASADYNTIKLKWDEQPNVTGYYVYRQNSSGKYKVIANLPTGTSSYKDKELTTGKTYSYKIKAYRTVGTTKYKSKISAAVSAKPIPKKAKIKSVVANETNGAVITWKKVNGASGYKIYRKVTGETKYKSIKTIKKQTRVTYTDKKLSEGNKYSYKVRAYTTVSKKRIYGKYSKVVSLQK